MSEEITCYKVCYMQDGKYVSSWVIQECQLEYGVGVITKAPEGTGLQVKMSPNAHDFSRGIQAT